MTYGSVVWGAAAKSHIKKLQVVQNKCLRVSTDAPIRTNMSRLQDELGIMTIKECLIKLNVEKIKKALSHENPLITQALDYNPTIRTRRNRPKSVLLHPNIP